MTDVPPFNPALLPAGFVDRLPPEAEAEAAGVETLMRVFAAHGYDRVTPPLLEFETTLLSGSGAAVAAQTFRLMDPDTRRMMALRPDMTPQIARIAATRLPDMPRPLRLSYAGPCVLMASNRGEGDRQISQAGVELIGPDGPHADAEIVALAAECLATLQVRGVSFDLTMPALTTALLDAGGFEGPVRSTLMRALDRKDAAAVARHGGDLAEVLIRLLHAAGPAQGALAELAAVDLPPAVRALSERLAGTVAAIEARVPGIRLTVDPVEFRGWQYHTGVCVSVYAAGQREELGRGGRYLSNDDEPACGITLRPDIILRAAPALPSRTRIFLPWGTPAEKAAALRAAGYATVSALGPDEDPLAQAALLACTQVVVNGQLVPVDGA
ncbi:ATP phosphoribosyltransferase regulatory subunit [Komagataeibacter sucrofermentans]|uniref:ATP phosphoribosyltransferase regulatory subunit n=1 Tax=Komagataeibacter sucrofermentans TaxID=1053551 RepID=A0A318QSB0_9PROT|nr:ATP phosphoribosyltransferase regulatory subunit [Komagataeibacter sucrofermentans]PYD81250.1 ATP phosphoribosyltransferase regulatory subunit [Komagataeibacter sucrofermentans]GBQ45022.1 histidyl-tRNA synthetase [Komagataeibacter sucrofermentans DSM 15973]